jgi:hypothetical protein
MGIASTTIRFRKGNVYVNIFMRSVGTVSPYALMEERV